MSFLDDLFDFLLDEGVRVLIIIIVCWIARIIWKYVVKYLVGGMARSKGGISRLRTSVGTRMRKMSGRDAGSPQADESDEKNPAVTMKGEEEDAEFTKRAETIGGVLRSAGNTVIFIIGLVMVLGVVNVPLAPLITGMAVLGLGVAFGLQTLVGDVINGLFILAENQFAVGNWIEVNGILGRVKEMTLRLTVLQDPLGTIHTIPNGEIRVVSNWSRDWTVAQMLVGVGYGENMDNAIEVLQNDVGQALKEDPVARELLIGEPQVQGVEGLDDSAVSLRLAVEIRPGFASQTTVQRRMRLLIHRVFAEKNVEIAYPHMDVTMTNWAGAASLAGPDGIAGR